MAKQISENKVVEKNESDLVAYLHKQISKAEKFTKDFIERNKKDVQLYESKNMSSAESVANAGGDVISVFNAQTESRYRFSDRMIFTNTEGAKATIFDRVPELIFKSRNASGDRKRQIVDGTYDYLTDKLGLHEFANDALHWFVLSGQTIANIDYMVKSYEAQVFNEDGTPAVDENGEPETYTKYEYDDPILSVGDPRYNFYSPASKFSVDMDKVPFNVKKDKMDVDVIKETFGVTVKNPTLMDETDDDEDADKVAGMTDVWFYCGKVDEEHSDLVEDWDVGSEHYFIVTKNELLFQSRRKRRQSKMAKWYSQPNKFFGFGFGVIGEPYQQAKEMRKGQIARAADVAAFAKLALKNDGNEKTDPEKWKDPRENLVVTYTSQKPEYVTAPGVGDSVVKDLEQTESDAQAAFGLLDISSGAQESSTVKTATGQTIFADAAARRLKYGKRLFMAFYRAVVIELFKQCQENWVDPKPITITDDDGNTEEIMVTKDDLADIDFDKDLDIDPESVTSNKDIMREQMISLYDKVKDDPLVDRRKVFADMLRQGFNISSPERYIKEASPVEPGTVLTNPETGEQFTVDESGTVISQEAQEDMATPDGEPVSSGGQMPPMQ